MKKILSLTLGLIIAFVGLNLFVHHQIKKEVNHFVEAASPFAQIDYQDLSISLFDKSLTINEIKIFPLGSAAPISIQTLSLHDVSFLQNKGRWFEQIEWDRPSHQGIGIEGLKVDLDEQLKYGNLKQLSQAQGTDPEFLKHLGYNTLAMNLNMSIQNIPKANKIELKYQQIHQDMFNIRFDATIKPTHTDIEKEKFKGLELEAAALEFEDHSFLNRYFSYLAKKQNQNVKQAKQKWMDDFENKLDEQKITLASNQLEAIQKMIFDSKPLTVSINPLTPMSQQTIKSLHLYQPNDVIKLLNLTIVTP